MAFHFVSEMAEEFGNLLTGSLEKSMNRQKPLDRCIVITIDPGLPYGLTSCNRRHE